MGNIRDIGSGVFRFDLYNLNFFKTLDIGIDAHWTFWYHKPTNNYVLAKFGDYCNLVSIEPIKDDPHFPEERQKKYTDELVKDVVRHSYFYNQDCQLSHGAYLLDDLEKAARKDEFGHSKEWFAHEDDEYFDYVMKTNPIFPVDYPREDYQLDKEYWDEVKRRDVIAIQLLTKN